MRCRVRKTNALADYRCQCQWPRTTSAVLCSAYIFCYLASATRPLFVSSALRHWPQQWGERHIQDPDLSIYGPLRIPTACLTALLNSLHLCNMSMHLVSTFTSRPLAPSKAQSLTRPTRPLSSRRVIHIRHIDLVTKYSAMTLSCGYS